MRMKLRILLLVIGILAGCSIAFAQAAATIEKTEISGISEDKLSAGLRADIQALQGKAYDEKVAAQLAERIQSELPEFVATTTTSPGTQAGNLRLVFVVAHNINAKYLVESIKHYMWLSLPVRSKKTADYEHAAASERDHHMIIQLLKGTDGWALAQVCVDHLQGAKNAYLQMAAASAAD